MSVGPSTIFLSHNLSVIRNNVVKSKKKNKNIKQKKTGAVHWWSLKSHRLVALFFLFFCGHRNFPCDSLRIYAHKPQILFY
jgi:quinol-cytochrome oxidoreductase complex cytochrome b subunit